MSAPTSSAQCGPRAHAAICCTKASSRSVACSKNAASGGSCFVVRADTGRASSRAFWQSSTRYRTPGRAFASQRPPRRWFATSSSPICGRFSRSVPSRCAQSITSKMGHGTLKRRAASSTSQGATAATRRGTEGRIARSRLSRKLASLMNLIMSLMIFLRRSFLRRTGG